MNAVTDIFSPEMQYKVVNSFQCLLYYSAQCCYLTSGRCFAGSPPVHLITCLSVACLNLSGMKAKHLATQTLLRVHSSITPPTPTPKYVSRQQRTNKRSLNQTQHLLLGHHHHHLHLIGIFNSCTASTTYLSLLSIYTSNICKALSSSYSLT